MDPLRIALGCIAMLLVQVSSSAGVQPSHATSHLLVRFRQPQAHSLIDGLNRQNALDRLTDQLRLPPGARLEEPDLSRWMRRRTASSARAPAAPVALERFLYLRLPAGLGVEECLERLRDHPLLEYAEPDGIGSGGELVPNDPQFPLQWHHRNNSQPGADIHSTAAWEITTGSSNIIVAVLDTGLNANLSEFTGRLVAGWDYANSDPDPADDHGHGTAVAGTLCASANNATLGVGVDWHCRLMPVKVLDRNNVGYYSWWAQGIEFAVANGAKVINLSAGGDSSSTTLTRAINEAIAARVIFVTITHNDGTDIIRYPGRLPQCITVGATDRYDRRASFSNYGPEIDLVAPGLNIYTVNRSGGFGTWWGTSFSAPLVAGVCSLAAGICPDLTQEEAAAFLTQGADDQVGDATDAPGFDDYYGWGRLNAFRSILLAATNAADLSLASAANSSQLSPGCPWICTLSVSNAGPADAVGVLLTNDLPGAAALLSATATQGTWEKSGDTLVFWLGQLPRARTAVVRLVLSGASPGTFTNRAAVASDQLDLNLANNRATLATLIAPDYQPPTLLSAEAQPDATVIAVTFSEPLSPATATNLAHYRLVDGWSKPVPLSQARLDPDFQVVRLQAHLLETIGPYAITVTGIADCAGNPLLTHTPLWVALPPFHLVPLGADWAFLDDGSPPGTNWTLPSFDDQAWPAGPGQLGYGDGDEATTTGYGPDPAAKFITTYFRHSFFVPDPAILTNLQVQLLVDDGAILYLNGVEILRHNMPAGPVDPETLASAAITGQAETELTAASPSPTLLQPGWNLLAAEVHQAAPASSDLSFDLELSARLLTRALPPDILLPPQDHLAVEGDTVTFRVEVFGTPPLGYGWRHDAHPIVPLGEGTPTLTLSNVQLADAGAYRLVVTNSALPTPGLQSQPAQLTVLADTDRDGLPDTWELANGLDPLNPLDAMLDSDHDAFSNLHEYSAGTDPRDPSSRFKIDQVQIFPDSVQILFLAISNRSYSIQFREPLAVGPWRKLADLPSAPSNRVATFLDSAPSKTQRAYRLLIPLSP